MLTLRRSLFVPVVLSSYALSDTSITRGLSLAYVGVFFAYGYASDSTRIEPIFPTKNLLLPSSSSFLPPPCHITSLSRNSRCGTVGRPRRPTRCPRRPDSSCSAGGRRGQRGRRRCRHRQIYLRLHDVVPYTNTGWKRNTHPSPTIPTIRANDEKDHASNPPRSNERPSSLSVRATREFTGIPTFRVSSFPYRVATRRVHHSAFLPCRTQDTRVTRVTRSYSVSAQKSRDIVLSIQSPVAAVLQLFYIQSNDDEVAFSLIKSMMVMLPLAQRLAG